MAQAVGKKTKESFFTGAFSSFSADDIGEAKKFYGETLGVDVSEVGDGLQLNFDDGGSVFIYPKDDHEPATADEGPVITLYRRVIENACSSREELQDLVHDVVVERTAEMLGVAPETLDPVYRRRY